MYGHVSSNTCIFPYAPLTFCPAQAEEPANGVTGSTELEGSAPLVQAALSEGRSVALEQLQQISQLLARSNDSSNGKTETDLPESGLADLPGTAGDLTSELAAAQQAKAELQEEYDQLRTQLASALQDVQQLDTLRHELAELQASLQTAEHEHASQSELAEEVSRLQQEVQTFKEQASSMASLTQEHQQLQSDLVSAKDEAEQLQQQLAKVKSELQGREQNVIHADAIGEQHAAGTEKQLPDSNSTELELETLRQQVLQLQSDLATAQQQQPQQQQQSQQQEQPQQLQITEAHDIDSSQSAMKATSDAQAPASLQTELHEAQAQIAHLQEELAGQQAAGHADISREQSLTAAASMALSQAEVGEPADDPMPVSYAGHAFLTTGQPRRLPPGRAVNIAHT